MKSIAIAMLAFAVATGRPEAVVAQPTTGDLLVASTGIKRGVFYTQSRVLGLVQLPGTNTLWPSAIAPSIDNRGVSILTTLSRAFMRFSTTGVATQVVPFPAPEPTDFAVDQDGDWVLSAGSRIYRLQGGTISTWATGTSGLYVIDRDQDTGDFLVGQTSQGVVMRVDRATGAASTIATGFGTFTMTGVAHNPVTGDYAVSHFGARTGLVLVPQRMPRVTVAIANVSCVTVHPWTGDYWAGTLDGRVYRVAPNGDILSSTNYGSDYLIRDLAFFGTRNVHLTGGGRRGSNVGIAVNFGRSPSKAYCVALAFSNRGGPQLSDGRRLWLAPDALLFTTACRDLPGITSGFVGTLDRGGSANAQLTIPAIVPIGTRIHVAAAAVNANLVDGLDLSNGSMVVVGR